MAVSSKKLDIFKSFRITPNPSIMNIQKISNFFPTQFKYGEQIVEYEDLHVYDDNYEAIEKLFEYSDCLEINNIVKVYNPYLKKSFELKRQLHYNSIQPTRLFHGTKEKYVQSICQYNFNWRYSGTERGHRHGKGVNFTTNPDFASIFCDKGFEKVIILAEVLVNNECDGSENLLVPPLGTDTATAESRKGVTYVKFDDCEFNPKYIIYCVKE